MGTLIDLNEWIEAKVNTLAQRYRVCREKAGGKELECTLKEWGHKMAKYKTHYARVERQQGQEKDGENISS